ncbi:MAG: TetR/AcrR family transcriptional regulator [Saprospiraceae bacterium]
MTTTSDYLRRGNQIILKREFIVQQAYEIFAIRGIKNTSFPQIAEDIGIALSEVERLFIDKNELVIACTEYARTGTRVQLEEMVEQSGEPLQKLIHLLQFLHRPRAVKQRHFVAHLQENYPLIYQNLPQRYLQNLRSLVLPLVYELQQHHDIYNQMDALRVADTIVKLNHLEFDAEVSKMTVIDWFSVFYNQLFPYLYGICTLAGRKVLEKTLNVPQLMNAKAARIIRLN